MSLTTRTGGLAILTALAALAVAFAVVHGPEQSPRAAATATVPGPTLDEPAGSSTSETAVLAGGCFWGVQGVFQHVRGVSSAVSGYAGGDASTAQYETVGTGTTGHAESVRITYDPTQVSYGQLLHIFFAVVNDPTELNRQGPDVGEQYRSAIFPQNDVQQKVADAYIAQLNQAKVFDGAGRHAHRQGLGLLPGRGLSPGLPELEPDRALHRDQRHAEARRLKATVSAALS